MGCIVGVVYCGRTPRPESTESAPIEDSVPECTYTAQSGDSVAGGVYTAQSSDSVRAANISAAAANSKEDTIFCFLGEAENRE